MRMSGLQLREGELAEQDDGEPSKKLGGRWARTGEGGQHRLSRHSTAALSSARREELRGESLAPAPTSFFSPAAPQLPHLNKVAPPCEGEGW